MMCIARLTRPDILLAISYLATKFQQPTDADYKNAIRVLSYLKETSTYGLQYIVKKLQFIFKNLNFIYIVMPHRHLILTAIAILDGY